MLSQTSQQQREDYLNDFIDSLILEYKPQPPTSVDQDLSAMLEVVRGVKRLREEKELLSHLTTGRTVTEPVPVADEKPSKPTWRKWWISGAAVAATLFLAVGIFNQVNRIDPAREASEEMAPAMMRSVEMAMEAPPAGEESVSAFGVMDTSVNAGVAVVVRQLEYSYLELRLIDLPAHYQEFRISKELLEAMSQNTTERGGLYSVVYEVQEGGVPVLTMLQPLKEAIMEARYLGRTNSNFAEFIINENVQVMALSEEAKKTAEAFDKEVGAGGEGVLTRITLIGSSLSTNGMVNSMEKISE